MRPALQFYVLGILLITVGCSSVPILKDRAQRDAYVGKKVCIVGEVSNTKIPAILGIEIDSFSPDLRGEIAEAEGILVRYEFSKEEFDKKWREMGPFQSQGPGVFYRLKRPFSNQTAKVRPPNQRPEHNAGATSPSTSESTPGVAHP